MLLLILVVGVGACTFWFARSYGSALAVITASNGRITTFNVNTSNGRTSVTFQAAQGIGAADGVVLACDVVRPRLAGTDLENADWVIVDRAGDVIGSKATPCP